MEAQNLKAMPAEEEWHIHAIYGRESENVETAADAPQVRPSTACVIIGIAKFSHMHHSKQMLQAVGESCVMQHLTG